MTESKKPIGLTPERLIEIYHHAHTDGFSLGPDRETNELLKAALNGVKYDQLLADAEELVEALNEIKKVSTAAAARGIAYTVLTKWQEKYGGK